MSAASAAAAAAAAAAHSNHEQELEREAYEREVVREASPAPDMDAEPPLQQVLSLLAFTSTKVQILTPEEQLTGAPRRASTPAWVQDLGKAPEPERAATPACVQELRSGGSLTGSQIAQFTQCTCFSRYSVYTCFGCFTSCRARQRRLSLTGTQFTQFTCFSRYSVYLLY